MSGYLAISRTDDWQKINTTVIDKPLELNELQSFVGGLIEPAFTIPSPVADSRSLTAYVNEEGRCIGLCDFIVIQDRYGQRSVAGPMIVGALKNGDGVPLTNEELDYLVNRCKIIRTFNLDTNKHELILLMILENMEELDNADY
jgi:hypothetical protein